MACKTTASKKAKGRKLQQIVRDKLLSIGKDYGLKPGDIVSTGMGQSGVDVVLSPAAITLFDDLKIECKNTEALNVTGVFFEHDAKYKSGINLLIHKRNKTEPLVTMTLETFLMYIACDVSHHAKLD